MKITPREKEGLLIHQLGYIAQKRLARGVKLNHPEAIALITSQVQELARDGHLLADLIDKGKSLLGRAQIMDGVADLISEVQVEATFVDGTKLVAIDEPVNRKHGDLKLALYGSFLPIPDVNLFEDKSSSKETEEVQTPPGCIYPVKDEEIEINKNRKKIAITVKSVSDRPIQVGSHYHFIEVNKSLVFDRALSYGKRLNIPAGNAVRFEPGDTKTVTLVDIGGKRIIRGGNGLCDGPVHQNNLKGIMEKVTAKGFGYEVQNKVLEPKIWTIPRFKYIRMYGPTVGDKIKLADTSLIIEIEKDFTIYGDECKFGGGKVLREGMGQASNTSTYDALDTVITNCLIVDPIQGVIKADVGIKDGMIIKIGKAGNNDIMDITPGMVIGAGTDTISGEGHILTAGGIDIHVHFICPQLAEFAITSGLTTLIGGGTGPSTQTRAITSTPNYNHIRAMIKSTDAFPLNFGFTGKGNTSLSKGLAPELVEQIEAGAIGLKIHEDVGSTPSAIDTALTVADAYGIQITIHTDTLNESCNVEGTIAAFNGRNIHAYHVEGAGGGHAPDIISICGEANVIPSSTTPTRPYSKNTIDEHMDMLMVCHHLDRYLPEDIAFAESRIRHETIAAEDVLHDVGAISIIGSDSQAMGRIGEVIIRTWQTADKMKKHSGQLPQETGSNDNFRVLRYLAKYTINPAIAHGINHIVGSIEVNKLADLVLWEPAFFGVKPSMVIKGGQIVYSAMGNPNASIPTPEPVICRKMFGAFGKSVGDNSCIFVSKLSHEKGTVQKYGITKRIVPILDVRKFDKRDMVHNNFIPKMKVDPESYGVFMKEKKSDTIFHGEEEDWKHVTVPAAETLPLTQKYFIF